MFTSTSPCLLLRPIVIRVLRTKNSKSRPSRRAITLPFSFSSTHGILLGLAGADLSARRAQASLSEACRNVAIPMLLGCGHKMADTYENIAPPHPLSSVLFPVVHCVVHIENAYISEPCGGSVPTGVKCYAAFCLFINKLGKFTHQRHVMDLLENTTNVEVE